MTYGNSKLAVLCIETLELISAREFPLYRPVVNDIGPMLGYISPFASDRRI